MRFIEKTIKYPDMRSFSDIEVMGVLALCCGDCMNDDFAQVSSGFRDFRMDMYQYLWLRDDDEPVKRISSDEDNSIVRLHFYDLENGCRKDKRYMFTAYLDDGYLKCFLQRVDKTMDEYGKGFHYTRIGKWEIPIEVFNEYLTTDYD